MQVPERSYEGGPQSPNPQCPMGCWSPLALGPEGEGGPERGAYLSEVTKQSSIAGPTAPAALTLYDPQALTH